MLEIRAGRSVSYILHAQNIPEGRTWKRIRLAFLSPKILRAIVDGTTNLDLTIKMLTQHDLPLDWLEQEALFLSWIPCYRQLNSLLTHKNRENPPSRNEPLRFSGNYCSYERWYAASAPQRCSKSLNLRRNSARTTSNRNDEDVVAVLSDKSAQASVID